MANSNAIRLYTTELLRFYNKDWPDKYKRNLLELWRESAKRGNPMYESYRAAVAEIDREAKDEPRTAP